MPSALHLTSVLFGQRTEEVKFCIFSLSIASFKRNLVIHYKLTDHKLICILY